MESAYVRFKMAVPKCAPVKPGGIGGEKMIKAAYPLPDKQRSPILHGINQARLN